MVTPLLTLWSNFSLSLSDRSGDSCHIIIADCVVLEHFSTQVPEMLLRFFCLSRFARVILFFKVIREIQCLHGAKHRQ